MTKKNIVIILATMTLILLAEVVFFNDLIYKREKQQTFLVGKKIEVLSNKHFEQGAKITYNSNPPTSGTHYPDPQHAGVYTKAPPDGNLVHSLEHGTIIIWYNPKKLSREQIKVLTDIFKSIHVAKKIMTPRDTLPTAVALSSWGRLLQLQTIEENQIREFFRMNYDKGPEKASI
jgi:hypothetical protein